ncbi:MAG: deoxyribonuclease V [Planctomycetes bacterium]|nr:deoxyribonuclease V [Planctomycetota bacterium]
MKRLHKWNLTFRQAIALQKQLAHRVKLTPVRKPPGLVAGLDCAFSRDGHKIIAAVVVLKLPDFELIETATAVRNLTFPYIPGLLSFREAPACLAAVEKLKIKPDVFIIDGQGIAHPRRFGIASHLGLFLDKPTIGCAKSHLIGDFEMPPLKKGAYSLLKDKGETIGAVLRTRTKVRPVFVSVGNKCTLEDAIGIVLACTTKYRLPEPARLAHQLVGKLKLKT